MDWEKNTSSIQKKAGRREKDGTSKHTKNDGKHTSKYDWPLNCAGPLIDGFFKKLIL